ncbi:MAG: thiamine-phosphate kinase [Hyphomicrobium sp.]
MSDRIASETELIQTFLAPLAAGAPGAFGLLDDAALLPVPPDCDLVVTTDPIIAGVHFFVDDSPQDIAWKALAVNVSDLAAKGAAPLAYTLALAFPEAPERAWMARFAAGLQLAQQAFDCHLIGGDTDRTTGPFSIGVTAFGTTPKGRMVRRAGARAGDRIFVSGTLGEAALGLRLRRDPKLYEAAISARETRMFVDRYLRPRPRVDLIDALRTSARAALDISDGFVKDLTRLVGDNGATIAFSSLPISTSLRSILDHDTRVADLVLNGGDEYEVLAAVAPDAVAGFVAKARLAGVAVTDVGIVGASSGVTIIGADGQSMGTISAGYDHFAPGR